MEDLEADECFMFFGWISRVEEHKEEGGMESEWSFG